MQLKPKFFLFLIIILISLLQLSCKARSQNPAKDAKEKKLGLIQNEYRTTHHKGKSKKRMDDKNSLGPAIFPITQFTKDRFLEYKINLKYECTSLTKSRRTIIQLLNKYGYIKQSNAYTKGKYPNLNMQINVKVSLLYKALVDFEQLGSLISESIYVVDHTESMVLKKRQVRRENLRIARKNRNLRLTPGNNKYWKDKEENLEKNENNLDAAKHKQWKIKDQVAWAKININISTPAKPDVIEVPNYLNALKGAVNFILEFLYVILLISPILIIGLLIYLKRNKIKAFFTKKK